MCFLVVLGVRRNLPTSSKSCNQLSRISNVSNLLTPNLGPPSRRFSTQCLNKRWRGTGPSSYLSGSTPTSPRYLRLGSCDLAGLNPELPGVSKVGGIINASTIALDIWILKASISLGVGERISKSLMTSQDHPDSRHPSPPIQSFSTLSSGRAALHTEWMFSLC